MQYLKRRLSLAFGAGAMALVPAVASAQEGEIEEVVVTGSYIRGSAEDAPSPVQVTTREDMDLTGNPSVLEMIRNMGPVSGIDGETNQFQSNGLEGVSNINMRGLGPGRNLVLVNGARMAPNPYFVAESGQQFVNTNAIPAIALERIELLTDGASATYGSDAITGVANFITRSDFRGIEFQGAFKAIDDSEDDGDWDAGAIIGFGTDRLDVVTSFGYQFRSQLQVPERNWALRPFAENPRGGFSTIGAPGTYYAFDFSAVAPDPDCEVVGGHLTSTCNFRYTDFDNISEEEEHWQTFTEATFQLTDSIEWHAEFLYSKDEIDKWNTSPSYPPQTLFGTDRSVVPGMPHFDDFIARNPQFVGTALENGFIVRGRFQGVDGPAQEGDRKVDFYRFSTGLTGELNNGVLWDANISYSKAEGERNTPDSRVDRVAYAYRGLGGPGCDVNTGVPGSGNLGTGDCFYFNPFTSGYTQSLSATATDVPPPGSENAQLNNPAFMQDWMTDFVGTEVDTELFVFDFVLSGETDIVAGGGNVGWAAGVQYRRDDYDSQPNSVTDITQQPCAFGLDGAGDTFTIGAIDIGGGNSTVPYTYTCEGNGAFHFLAGALPFDADEDVYAAFGELSVPLFENVEMQVAVRYEDYGGDVGDTLDPKVAVRWDVTDTVALRGSLSSSFRGPSLNQLGGTFTSLQFVTSELAFKAIDTNGNENLDPEEAITTNLGIIWQPTDSLFMSIDYWNFDFDNPIVLENFNDVISASQDPTDPANELALSKIQFQDPGDPTSGVQRVNVTYQNGPGIETDGIDWNIEWDIAATDWGLFTVGNQGTYINSFEVDDWIWADGFDAEGDLNRFENITRPLPEVKTNFFVNWTQGGHNLRLQAFYTDEYDDKSQPAGADWSIDDQWTVDLHYNWRFLNDNARIFASVYNLTDEDPPQARLDLNYDPYTHNPFGRMVKVGLTYRLEAGIFR